ETPSPEQPTENQQPDLTTALDPQSNAPNTSVMPTPMSPAPVSPVAPPPAPAPAGMANDLSDIKKNAIDSLKPLLGKLQSSPEDTFDAYLLIIRSTDDSSLIIEAYAAAQNITDETRKA